MLPNGYPCLVAFLAVTWTRAVAAPLNGASTLDEYLFYLEDIATNVRSFARPLFASPSRRSPLCPPLTL